MPVGNQCCGQTSPRGSYCVCKKPCSNSCQETLKKIKIYYLQDLEIIYCTWAHTVRSQVERPWAWGSAFIAIEGFRGLTLGWWI